MVVKKTIYPIGSDMTEKLVYPDPMSVNIVCQRSMRSDGRELPSSRSFHLLVTLYKVLLIIATICLLGSVILVAIGAILVAERQNSDTEPITGDEADTIREFHALLPVMFVAMVFYAIELVIGWIAVMTLRLKYLRINLFLQIGLLAVAVMHLLSARSYPSAQNVLNIVVQVGEVCLIQSIIDQIRAVRRN